MELGGSFLFKGILDISGRKIITGEIYFYARPEGDQIPKGELGIKGGGGGVETLKNMLMSEKDKGQISFHPKT